ncbi:MAG: hypothetical protein IT379_39770, partial [Deltaproteobacteria bacterium]|nr:hypothetical protein [Deltaproteobacteria bacterium]
DACVDTRSSNEHCGACTTACAPGSPCRDGTCACAAPLAVCTNARGEEECADLATDTAHCGTCGNRCAAGASCVSGTCACDAGQTACTHDDGRAVCADPRTSVLHCGRCGNRCGVGAECLAGACECPPGRVACPSAGAPDRCADLATDDSHCGACGRACGSGEICFESRCVDACPVGTACTTTADCRGTPAAIPTSAGATCIPEGREVVTVGDTTWTQVGWSGGYCIDHYGIASATGSCSPRDDRTCDACSRCVPLANDPTHGLLYACVRRCDPAIGDWRTTRSGCREGYQCHLTEQLCVPGCSSDEECRATFLDANANFLRDPGETTIDPTSVARCDATTGRCVDLPFDPAATFGGPCTDARDCPEDGLCIAGWPGGGSCGRVGCTLPGRECGGGAVCFAPFGSVATGMCLDDCTVGDETDPSRVVGSGGGDPDCRVAGYRCQSLDGSARGGCLPGGFNDIVEPNVGAECTSHTECWSPYGNGECLRARGRGYCTVTQCGITPFAIGAAGESLVCPPGTICEGDPATFTSCVPTCDPALGAAACRDGYRCIEVFEPRAYVCYPACRDGSDCFDGQTCDGGVCRD